MEELRFTVTSKIQRPVGEVFDAVYNPKRLTQYFTTASASGPLDEGTTVYWNFADFPTEGGFPVKVTKVVPNERIEIDWESAEGGYDTHVEMTFEALSDNETLVKITESGWKNTEKGRDAAFGNCHGWTQMSASLKAFVEYGINLRKGYY